MQAARQEALQDRVTAPRHHVHQALAEPAGAAVQLCTWRVRACRRLLYGPAVSADVFRGATSGRNPMGIPSLLPIRLSHVLCHPITTNLGTAFAAKTVS